MIKTLKNVKLNDKEKLKQMRFVQNCIPIEQVFEDGIFRVLVLVYKYGHEKLNAV